MIVQPVTLHEANAFVAAHHRHHSEARGCRFCLGAWEEDRLVGVAIVSRPVARSLQDRNPAKVVRLCTDGTRNACSALYGACRRVWRAMGGRRLITYILDTEPGTSLRAAGWVKTADLNARKGSNCAARERTNQANPARQRWEAA